MIHTNKLTEMYEDFTKGNVSVFFTPINFDCESDAVIIKSGDYYGCFFDINKIHTVCQENMAVGHEWGHFITGTTHTVDAPPAFVSWCENKAHCAQIRKLLPFDEINQALIDGKTSVFELAEHFDVTEDFVIEAINYYKENRGLTFSCDLNDI